MNVPNLIERWSQLRDEMVAGEINYEQVVLRYHKLIQLNESKPELGHFIRCTKDNKPLDKPETLYISEAEPPSEHESFVYDEKWKEYQEAQSRQKWKGWELGRNGFLGNEFGNSIGRMRKDGFQFLGRTYKIETYGDILTAGIHLEPTVEYAKELKL